MSGYFDFSGRFYIAWYHPCDKSPVRSSPMISCVRNDTNCSTMYYRPSIPMCSTGTGYQAAGEPCPYLLKPEQIGGCHYLSIWIEYLYQEIMCQTPEVLPIHLHRW